MPTRRGPRLFASCRQLGPLDRRRRGPSEGILRFRFPCDQGVGRFAKIGIPAPEIMAPFVGVCKIVCGVLFLVGLLTRFVGTQNRQNRE
jgi:hypothetical protein